jgi:hypothetical protein
VAAVADLMSHRPRDREFEIEDPSDDTYVWRVRYYPHSGRSYWTQYKRVVGRLVLMGRVEPADEYDAYYGGT